MSKLKLKNRCNALPKRRAPDRLLRVAELIRRELFVLLQTKVRDPRIDHVVITRVQVSPDLSSAKVYIMPAGDQQQLNGLRHAAGFLRSALGARLNLRMTPKLLFVSEMDVDKGRHGGHLAAE